MIFVEGEKLVSSRPLSSFDNVADYAKGEIIAGISTLRGLEWDDCVWYWMGMIRVLGNVKGM